MKWTNEKLEQLIELRAQKKTYAQIAAILDCSENSAKTYGSKLIKEGRLDRAKTHRKYTRDELIEVVKSAKRRDDCPMEYRHYIKEEFGGWTKALEAAGLAQNCGGLLDYSKPATLYLLKFDGFYKIGITQRPLSQRAAKFPSHEILDTYCSDLDEILALEREILSKVERFQPDLSWFERNGKTECFLFPFDPTFDDLI